MAKRKYRRRKKTGLDPVLSRGIIAIVIIIFSIVVILSFFDMAGAVGIVLNDYVLSFLFGSIRYAVPFVLITLALFLFRDIEYNYRPLHTVGAGLFFLGLSSLMHIKFAVSEMWRMSLNGHGGGIFGMLAWPMKAYLGEIAGSVVLIGLVVVAFFLIFNTSLTHFIMINRKLISGFGWLGRLVVAIFKKFVRGNDYNGDFVEDEEDQIEEDVEEGEDYEEEMEEDEEVQKKIFNKKKVSQSHGREEKEVKNNSKEEKNSSPWDKKVFIKNLPPTSLLSAKKGKPTSGDIKANSQIIKDTFSEFKIEVEMGEIKVGPTVTQYSLKPAKGVKLSRITSLSNDLSLSLAAHPIRIEAPIPGKSLVGIEVPNFKAAMVSLKEMLESKAFATRKHNMMVALGKDVSGKVWFADLPKMPHLLVAGATGSGKTVCINSIIMSLLYQNTAETLRMIMVDPKRVELTLYNGIPHLLTPVITNVQKTVNALKWSIGEMDRRFEQLSKDGSRDINSYNSKHPNDRIPNIVFVIDELADLMAGAASEVEAGIIRLAQMARAVGIHLIVATQRPSVDVITGLMKANIPGRIAFSVASVTDSRTILDCPGAEKLLGRGDMLMLTADLSKPKRIQGAFISEKEVNEVVNYLQGDDEPEYDESIVEKPNSNGTSNMFGGSDDGQDDLFEEAKQAIFEAGKASASFLQRRLRVGYARAARILDELESAGIVGPSDGAKPREILATFGEEDVVENDDAGAELNVFSGNEDDDEGDGELDEDQEDDLDDDGDDEVDNDEEEDDEDDEDLGDDEDQEEDDLDDDEVDNDDEDEFAKAQEGEYLDDEESEDDEDEDTDTDEEEDSDRLEY